MTSSATVLEVPALRVSQWLPGWDRVIFRDREHRRRPEDHFYVFSMTATDLQRLAGVYPRSVAGGKPRSEDLAIQRQQDERRIEEIARYVRLGFPLSDLVDTDEAAEPYRDLRKPGWLATAIVMNIIRPGEQRGSRRLAAKDAVRVVDSGDSLAHIRLPAGFRTRRWRPAVPPLEVIDGQHRLWSFTKFDVSRDFQLPVVAFCGLDISWQAYLFWTINITPKRINPSLAFDLYPLLRTEDWLERYGGEKVYRETRAQELVEALWSHPESPWHMRINMLGERGTGQISQAAWVRTLLATFVKSWESRRAKIGGLFGAPMGAQRMALPWGRAQQAALLIYFWRSLALAVEKTNEKWATRLRREADVKAPDPAMFGDGALLGTDQGVRGAMYIANDMLFVRADELGMRDWTLVLDTSATDVDAVNAALRSLQGHGIGSYIRSIAEALTRFDWRTSAAPGLTRDERVAKAALRGSGGYKEIRQQLLEVLSVVSGPIGKTSKEVARLLRYA